MLDIGWAELMLIGVVALIVIGPKDLPDMFRTMGRFTAKMRSMARDFQRAMDQAAKESGIRDVAADLRATTSAKSLGLDAVKDAASKFEKWDPLKGTTPKAAAPPPMMAGAGSSLTPVSGRRAAVATEIPAPAPTPAKAAMGPATQALADKQAAKRAVIKETTDKLKAIDAPAVPPVVKPLVKAATLAPDAPAKKPRAPRKKVAPTEGDA